MTTDSSANLLESQRQLAAEELCLKKMLLQIDEQINVLQIEQLHLIALLKKSSECAKGNEIKLQDDAETEVEELDLSVSVNVKVNVEEEEEDEDDEDL